MLIKKLATHKNTQSGTRGKLLLQSFICPKIKKKESGIQVCFNTLKSIRFDVEPEETQIPYK